MDSEDPKSTKQRKLASGQDDSGAKGRSALRALRLGLARAARDVLELPCAVIGATQARLLQDDVPDALGEDRILILVDGPDRAIGVVSVDRGCLTALIQQQTMCRVTGGAPSERAFTPTDAAMVAPLLNGAIERAAVLAEIPADKDCLTGFRFGAKADDIRAVILALEAERFRLFDLTIDFDSGKMQGRMTLALPELEPGAEEEDGALAESRARMQRAVGAAQADLMAVIGHLRLPLSKLEDMKAGDVLPLVHDRLNQADLIAIDGRKITSVRLGQAGGWRAVRFGEAARRDLNTLTEEQDFQSNALARPEPEMPTMGMGAPMPGDMQLPATTDMPAMGDIDLPGFGGDAEEAGTEMMGFPAMSEDDGSMPLPDMSPEAAAAEITELAGLEMEMPEMETGDLALPQGGEDFPAMELDLPMAEIDIPLPNAG